MEDLSHLVPGLVPSSMAGTNTVSTDHAMSAPGSVSESTAHETPGDPSLSVPAPSPRTVIVTGSGEQS
jgi:hypothetical protein